MSINALWSFLTYFYCLSLSDIEIFFTVIGRIHTKSTDSFVLMQIFYKKTLIITDANSDLQGAVCLISTGWMDDAWMDVYPSVINVLSTLLVMFSLWSSFSSEPVQNQFRTVFLVLWGRILSVSLWCFRIADVSLYWNNCYRVELIERQHSLNVPIWSDPILPDLTQSDPIRSNPTRSDPTRPDLTIQTALRSRDPSHPDFNFRINIYLFLFAKINIYNFKWRHKSLNLFKKK